MFASEEPPCPQWTTPPPLTADAFYGQHLIVLALAGLNLYNTLLRIFIFLDSVSMQCFRTDTTLCVPNPQFNCSKKHYLSPSPSMPIHKFLLTSYSVLGKSPGGGVPFELWSRFYYPNVRDQLLAKVSASNC